MTQSGDDVEFPDVFMDTLGEDEVASYFTDLGLAAQVHELRVKGGASDHSMEGGRDLDRCAQSWLNGQLYALQITYTFDEQVWCDTLQRTPEGTRVVRLLSAR